MQAETKKNKYRVFMVECNLPEYRWKKGYENANIAANAVINPHLSSVDQY
jgi:hypothetical protein